jgi:hypothetical protein
LAGNTLIPPPQLTKHDDLDESNAEAEQDQSTNPDIKKFEVSECQIYGYFFLTEPAHIRALDPITVGCIFKVMSTGKVFIRVRKLVYKLNYLTQFIDLDPDTGYFCNKFTHQHITSGDPTKNQDVLEILHQVLLQHHE